MCRRLRFSAIFSVILYSFVSFLMLSSHYFLGLHLLLFPCTCLVLPSPSFFNMWPYQRSRLLAEEGCHWFNDGFPPVVTNSYRKMNGRCKTFSFYVFLVINQCSRRTMIRLFFCPPLSNHPNFGEKLLL